MPLTACWAKGRNIHYAYYCPKKGCESYGKSIKREVIEAQFAEYLQTLQPMLRQIVQNFIDNAFKFSGVSVPRFVEIGCRIELAQRVFYVRDNGAGFDMTYAQNLFGMFQRMQSSRAFRNRQTFDRAAWWPHLGGKLAECRATFFFTLEGAELPTAI